MNKEVLRVALKPLTFVNKIVKKKDIIFFYSNLGFRDNVKAFFDYLIDNGYNKEYRIVVSANDWKYFVDSAPDNVIFVNNKKGILYFLRSKYAFYSFGKYPIKPAKNQKVVNLWHGMPLKRLGNMEKGLEKVDYNGVKFPQKEVIYKKYRITGEMSENRCLSFVLLGFAEMLKNFS